MIFKSNLLKYVSVVITIFLLVSCTGKTTENQATTTTTTTPIPPTPPKTVIVPNPPKETIEQTVVDFENLEYKDVPFQTLNGKKVRITDYKGKRVLLNFWATWCGPCVSEMPSLNEAYKILEDEGYVFLAASNQRVGKIKSFAKANPYDFTFVKCDEQFRPFSVPVIPTTLIFDTNGEVAMTLTGRMAWDKEEVMSKLRSVN